MSGFPDFYASRGWTDIHGGPPEGAFWRGRNPKTGKVERLPPFWRFSIWCGGMEREVRVEAATCAMECTDRYVWRDGQGNWIAEVLASAVIGPPEAGEEGIEGFRGSGVEGLRGNL